MTYYIKRWIELDREFVEANGNDEVLKYSLLKETVFRYWHMLPKPSSDVSLNILNCNVFVARFTNDRFENLTIIIRNSGSVSYMITGDKIQTWYIDLPLANMTNRLDALTDKISEFTRNARKIQV